MLGFIFQNFDLEGTFFKNIRDINRYCNALDFYLYSVDKEYGFMILH